MMRSTHLNAGDPNIDYAIAIQLRQQALEAVRKDRDEWDAQISIKPLVPHVSIKSIREQRRSARRVLGWS
jgi:hypothetical protein